MKSIIITGATSGIGFEAALELARMAPDSQLIIATRDQSRATETIKKITRRTKHRHVVFMPLDLASLQSVREFVTGFSAQPHRELHALINNAGMQQVSHTGFTKDGFENTFGVNHLAPFYLTMLLLPFMTDNRSSITFTASGTHDPLQKTGMPAPVYTSAEQLAHPPAQSTNEMKTGQIRYSTSKLCNILTTYELQRHVEARGIRVNAFDPGFVPGTGLARNYSPFLRFISGYIFKVLILIHHQVHTAKTSGKRLAHLAIGDEFTASRGKYFEGKKEIKSSKDSYRRDWQSELWLESIRLTGLTGL